MNRCVNFLTKELECATHEEAIERVYFVSAQEALYYKKKRNNNNSEEISSQLKSRFEQTPGFQQRIEEFLKFEDKLQVIILFTVFLISFCNIDKIHRALFASRRDNPFSSWHNRQCSKCSEWQKVFRLFTQKWDMCASSGSFGPEKTNDGQNQKRLWSIWKGNPRNRQNYSE